jgi:hypothetical protein
MDEKEVVNEVEVEVEEVVIDVVFGFSLSLLSSKCCAVCDRR